MARPLLAVILLVLSSSGCSEDAPGPANASSSTGGVDAGPLSARDFYIQVVDPELSESCSNCHKSEEDCTPRFLGESAEGSYDALRAFKGLVVTADDSNLILHGAHTGPALTKTQDEIVREWLALEFPDAAPEKTQLSSLKALGGCMTDAIFETTQFFVIAYQQTDSGPCGSCHKTGEAGTWIGYNKGEMLEKNRQLPWIKRLVNATFDSNGAFSDLVPSKRLVEKPEQSAQCGGTHPLASFDPPKELAIETFVQQSLDAWHQGNCE